MFDTVNFWIDNTVLSVNNLFDVLPYLSEKTEHKSEKYGYSCSGKILDYTVNIFENGISLKGSLCKSFFGDNLHTLTRKATQQAIEKINDCLHIDIREAKVTRLDVSTVIPTKQPPSDYYSYLGDKPYFERVQSTKNTLYYNNHQRQITFYDKTKEAIAKNVQIPDIWQNNNLLRYELRYTKRLNKQLNTTLTAAFLSDKDFYYSVIQNWYNEFKTIRKIKNRINMTDNITTPKEAKEALLAIFLQQSGQGTIDEYLNELKAKETFSDRKYYSRLKSELNMLFTASKKSEKNELMKELEMVIFDIAKYAR